MPSFAGIPFENLMPLMSMMNSPGGMPDPQAMMPWRTPAPNARLPFGGPENAPGNDNDNDRDRNGGGGGNTNYGDSYWNPATYSSVRGAGR